MIDDIFTTSEAASYLKVNKTTIYEWVKNLKLPCLHVGKFFRFRKSDLDFWLENQKDYYNKEQNKLKGD